MSATIEGDPFIASKADRLAAGAETPPRGASAHQWVTTREPS
jgi:hypothetical protein